MKFQRYSHDITQVVLHPSSVKGNSPAQIILVQVPSGIDSPTLVSSDTSLVSIQSIRYNRKEQMVYFNLRVISNPTPSRITVTATKGTENVTLTVSIEPAIAIPPQESGVVGAVTRLLMAEARRPSHPQYSEAKTLTSMQWMRLVLENRLANKPAQFGAAGARNLIDIIRAPNQFAGFSNYPDYSETIAAQLQEVIDNANNDNHPRQLDFGSFIQNAINVASNSSIIDPCPTGLYGWRTQGSGVPGGRFTEYQTIAGNTFYTLSSK
jgi:hypothetical protein